MKSRLNLIIGSIALIQTIPLKNWGATTSVIVTIEQEVGITQPTGQQVMTGSVSL